MNYFKGLLISIVFLSYFGNDGERLLFGLGDFLGVGTSLGFLIVVPLLFFTYISGGNILIFVSHFNNCCVFLLTNPTYFRRPCWVLLVCFCSSWPPTILIPPIHTLSLVPQLAKCWLSCVSWLGYSFLWTWVLSSVQQESRRHTTISTWTLIRDTARLSLRALGWIRQKTSPKLFLWLWLLLLSTHI